MGNNKHAMQPKPSSGKRHVVKVLIITLSVVLGVMLLGGGALAIGIYRMLNGMQAGPATTLAADVQESLINQMNAEDQASGDELAGLEEAGDIADSGVQPVADVEKGVYNFLLLGLDTREETELSNGRTDVNMIVTLDTIHNTVKLTSLMRDILLPIEGHDKNRINTIDVFLGPDALLKTVEKYTGVPIQGYVTVNFSCVTSIINILGGVDMELSAGEVIQTNLNIGELNVVDTINAVEPALKDHGAGTYHLSGKQAVSYMRIRHLAGDEFGRTERQRKVIGQVMKDMKNISMTDAMKLVTSITPYMKTNISNKDIISYATMLYGLRGAAVENLNVPVEGTYKNVSYKKMAVLQIDFEENAKVIQNFLYGDGSLVTATHTAQIPTPKTTTKATTTTKKASTTTAKDEEETMPTKTTAKAETVTTPEPTPTPTAAKEND